MALDVVHDTAGCSAVIWTHIVKAKITLSLTFSVFVVRAKLTSDLETIFNRQCRTQTRRLQGCSIDLRCETDQVSKAGILEKLPQSKEVSNQGGQNLITIRVAHFKLKCSSCTSYPTRHRN